MKYTYVLTIFEVDKPPYDYSSLVHINAPYHSFEVNSKDEAYEWLRNNGFKPKWGKEPFIGWDRWLPSYADREVRTHVATVTRLLQGLPKKSLDRTRWVEFLHEGHCE